MKLFHICLAFSVAMSAAVAKEPFAHNNAINTDGTSQISSVELAPRFLVKTFGKPSEEDHQKVSGTYTFVAAKDGKVFTLYDWNSTSLLEYGADLPSPKKFWALTTAVKFQIGGKDQNASEFRAWLLGKYRDWLAGQRHASLGPIHFCRRSLARSQHVMPGFFSFCGRVLR